MERFYHAFKWQTVVDYIKTQTKGIVLVASPVNGDDKLMGKLSAEANSRTIGIGEIYDDAEAQAIIYAANKPFDKTWGDWHEDANHESCHSSCELLAGREDALRVSTLVLMDHPNSTTNLHKILAETQLIVLSSTEKYINQLTGMKDADGDEVLERVPDVRWLYGRPSLPDFGNLTDEMFDLYRRDDVIDIDSLIPVYDFSAQRLSLQQLLDAPMKLREPVVLLNGQPLLRAESINELFAWRGTGKTLFSLGLGLHIAAGESMPGLEIPSPRKVLYVEGELPKPQLHERLKQLSAGLTVPDGNFEVLGKSQQDKGQAAVTIKTKAGRQTIEAAIEQMGAEVLFLDSIASLAQINTNNEADWFEIIEWMVELRYKGICVVYLQQAGKGGEQRGHSVSEDRLDLAIRLTATDNKEGAAFKMTFTKEREGSLTPLRLKCTKGVWAIDDGKQLGKSLKPSKKEERRKLILEALNSGEPQREISKRLKVSLSTINQIKKETTTNDHTSTDISS